MRAIFNFLSAGAFFFLISSTIFAQENATDPANVEKIKNSQDLATASEARKSAIKSFCTKKIKVDRSITEQLAASLQVNPRSISFERAEFYSEDDKLMGYTISKCIGIFYTQNGPLSCEMEFSKKGSVQKACDAYSVLVPYTSELSLEITAVMLRPRNYDKDGNKIKWADPDKGFY